MAGNLCFLEFVLITSCKKVNKGNFLCILYIPRIVKLFWAILLSYYPVPQTKLNCEVLHDDLGFELRWVMDGDDIVMQLVGKIDSHEYMAFGLSKDDARSNMDRADAIVSWVDPKTGLGKAVDYYLGSREQVRNSNDLDLNSKRFLTILSVLETVDRVQM